MYFIRPQPWSDWPCSHLQTNKWPAVMWSFWSKDIKETLQETFHVKEWELFQEALFHQKADYITFCEESIGPSKKIHCPRTINHDQGDQTFMAKDQEEVRAGQKDFRSKLKWFSQANFRHGFNSKLEWAHETHALFRKGLQCFLLKTWGQQGSVIINFHGTVFKMEEGDRNSNIIFIMGNYENNVTVNNDWLHLSFDLSLSI